MVPIDTISPNDMLRFRAFEGTRMVQPGVMSLAERTLVTVPFMLTANTRLRLARIP